MTGIDQRSLAGQPPDFTGSVGQWYSILGEILVETCRELGGSLSTIEVTTQASITFILSFDHRVAFFHPRDWSEHTSEDTTGILCVDDEESKGAILFGSKNETIRPDENEIVIRSGERFATIIVHDMQSSS